MMMMMVMMMMVVMIIELNVLELKDFHGMLLCLVMRVSCFWSELSCWGFQGMFWGV